MCIKIGQGWGILPALVSQLEIVMNVFFVRLQGNPYSSPLYDSRGREIITLDGAIEQAEKDYGYSGWEVYNGQEGETRFE